MPDAPPLTKGLAAAQMGFRGAFFSVAMVCCRGQGRSVAVNDRAMRGASSSLDRALQGWVLRLP